MSEYYRLSLVGTPASAWIWGHFKYFNEEAVRVLQIQVGDDKETMRAKSCDINYEPETHDKSTVPPIPRLHAFRLDVSQAYL